MSKFKFKISNFIQKFRAEFNAKVFGPFDEERPSIFCHGTTCCALTVMSCQNYHTIQEIENAVNHIKKDSNSRFFSPEERNYGERNILVICTPKEEQLAINLQKVGFRLLADDLKRRQGYPQGNLQLFMYSF